MSGFGNYDAWKLRSPDDEACFRLGYDPVLEAERAEEESWLESLEDPPLLAPWENDIGDEFDEWLAGTPLVLTR